jgi:chemotaxis protein MotB
MAARSFRFLSLPGPAAAESSGWMVTLSDMLLLLLTFFVLLISMSSFDQTMLIRTFGGTGSGSSGALDRGDTLPWVAEDESRQQKAQIHSQDVIYYRRLSVPLSQLLDRLEKDLGKALLRLEVIEQDLELELASDRLFGTLDDSLRPDGRRVLGRLREFFKSWSGLVEIAVYTDNFPLNTSRYPDNQVLAARRGERLVQALAALGLPASRVFLSAYGPDRVLEVNDTPAHRRRNRRIVFRLPEWATQVAGK